MNNVEAVPPVEAAPWLRELLGQKLVSVHRIVRYPPEQLRQDLKVDSRDYFRLAPGEVFFRFESRQWVRVGSDARLRTVLLSRPDAGPEAEAAEPDYLGRKGVVLSADDVRCSDDRLLELPGKTIENIGIIAVDDGDSRSVNQRGIALYAEGQKGIIVGLQLRASKVAHLAFLEFEDLQADLRPVLRNTGINGESLPY